MRDHFFPLNISVEELRTNTNIDWWSLHKGFYEYSSENAEISFIGKGNVIIGDLKWDVWVKKVFCTSASKSENDVTFNVKYKIKNSSTGEFEGYFGSEWCFNLLTGSADDRFLYSRDRILSMRKLGDIGDETDITHISIRDEWQGLEIEFCFDNEARVFNFPIETVSQSENGQERVHQGNVIIPCWRKVFYPESEIEVTIKVSVRSI